MALWSPSGPQYVEPGGVFWRSKLVLGPDGIPSRAAVGAPTLIYNERIQLNGISSRAAVGHPGLIYDQDLLATGIPSRAAVGSPRLLLGSELLATGIPSRKAIGSPRIDMHLVASGLVSRKGVGAPTLVLGAAPNVSYDATGAGQATSSTSGSFGITIGAGATCLMVGIQTEKTTATANIGGTTIPLLKSFVVLSSFPLYIHVFGLVGIPTGAQTINWTGGAASNIDAVTYDNVASMGTPVTATGTSNSMSHTVTGVSANDRIFQIFGCSGGTANVSAYSQTQRYNQWTNGTTFPMVIGDAPGGASVIFSATGTGLSSSRPWSSIAVPLSPT